MSSIPNLMIGDIIFRSGNPVIGEVLGSTLTHCGIYIGDNLIHDLYNNGLRNISIDNYLQEATDPKNFKAFRLGGKFSELIAKKLHNNIKGQVFYLPHNPKPWNMCSSAIDYNTANCMEYCCMQLTYAIWCLVEDPNCIPNVKISLKDLYDMSNIQGVEDLHIVKPMQIPLSTKVYHHAPLFLRTGDFNRTIFQNKWEDDTIQSHIWNTITSESFQISNLFIEVPVEVIE